MPPPSLSYASRSTTTGLDPSTLSDDEDDTASTTSHSTVSSSKANGLVLGFADGLIPAVEDGNEQGDFSDWKISRIGGEPIFPPFPSAPPVSSALCNSCLNPMPLLTQVYCPLDSSAYERVVYAFACPRSNCKGKQGCVRAWRAGIKWVDPELEKMKKREEEDKARKGKEVKVDLGSLIFGGAGTGKTTTALNPFAAAPNSANSSSNPFAPKAPKAETSVPATTAAPTPRAQPSLNHHTWPGHSSFEAQYLTTSYEPTPKKPASSSQLTTDLSSLSLSEPSHREGKGSGGRTKKGAPQSSGSPRAGSSSTDGAESYEVQKIKGIDEVFLKFQERIALEPEQLIRYEFHGEVLAFSETSVPYQTVFGSRGESGNAKVKKSYPCLSCGGRTVFEYQLMPNLVNLLNKEVKEEGDGFEWSTVWVFACENECVNEQTEQAWREERVYIEWEE